jgi:Heparinase II/III-like protein
MSQELLKKRARPTGGRLLVALMVLALGGAFVGPSAASASTTPSPVARGMKVLEPLPEPLEAQFTGGPVFVPPTAPPATDVGARRIPSLAAPTYTCTGFGGIDGQVPVSALMQDTFTWGPWAPYRVGNGSGNVNWRLNPYKNPSWYMWLHSLRWLGQGIIAGSQGDMAALGRVATIASDWVIDNPYSWKGDIGAWESTMHRTNVLICLRQAVLTAYDVTSLPPSYAWLDTALNNHAAFLINNWSGTANHGTDESLALFGVGCLLNRPDYNSLAITRLGSSITTAIDTEGSTNEQSTAYAQFNYSLWGRAETVLQACNTDPGTTIGARRALLATWLAHATDSNGDLHQIGDSEVVPTYNYPGTPMEYAATEGASGVAPASLVARYSRGYIFGRSGWGTPAQPFSGQSTYSIRYGASRALHGHSDHMSLTYTARGRTVLVDAGHAGYQNDAWRVWARGATAHSSMTTPLAAETFPATAMTRSLVKPTSDFYEFHDVPGAGISRTRGVLVLKDPDLVVTLDRATSQTAQQFQTLWHLPSDQVATVYSRTTAIAAASGDTSRTILLQLPYKQALPAGATLVKRGLTSPIQGWQYPNIFQRNAAPTAMFARSGTSASILSFIAPVGARGALMYHTHQSGTSTLVDLSVDGHLVRILISAGGGLVRQ